MEISLPDELGAFVQSEAVRRGFRDPGEFMQSLLEAERHRQVRREIESLLLEAIDGPFSEWTNASVEGIRRTGKRLIEQRESR